MHRAVIRFKLSVAASVFALASAASMASAASVSGVVTDTSGAKVKGAVVSLVAGGKAIVSTVSKADGGFELLTGAEGRFYLVISARSFRQLETPGFYAGRADSVERNLILEPEWVRESVVVTATGTPKPQSQVSETTTVLEGEEIQQKSSLSDVLRTVPGVAVSDYGQKGMAASLYVRGGRSDANKVLIDGVDAGDLGGAVNFGILSPSAFERVEIYRGTNSNLYGANAGSSVINLRTARGVTSFPSLLVRSEGGSQYFTRNEATLAGARGRFDYLTAFSWLQTANDMPNNEHHAANTTGNFGWQPTATLQLRGTAHYSVNGVGVPGPWDFSYIAENAAQKDQNLILSGALDYQTTPEFHNVVRYGGTRKREQYNVFAVGGSGAYDAFGYGCPLGNTVTITGANGYSVTGQALLPDCSPYRFEQVSNRDQAAYQGDYRIKQRVTAVLGYQYTDERGVYNYPDPFYAIHNAVKRTDNNFSFGFNGDLRNRFFYNFGGGVEHNTLFGTVGSMRSGLALLLFKAHGKTFSGTRLHFNFGDGYREPSLAQESSSLYKVLISSGYNPAAYGVSNITAPKTRSYEGGFSQDLFQERLKMRVNLFHNQFGREIESVNSAMLKTLFPLLPPGIAGYVNSMDTRAMGAEVQLEGGLGAHLFLRGGYTYVDAVVQRSLSSDNAALIGGYAPTYNGIPIGAYSPLKGARPFNIPPHTGFFSARYNTGKFGAQLTGSFASRSDGSTFLMDKYFGSSMLLPNRNLNHGYARIDLGGEYQLRNWLRLTGQIDNLTNNQSAAPLGYRSLPVSARGGVMLDLGKAAKR